MAGELAICERCGKRGERNINYGNLYPFECPEDPEVRHPVAILCLGCHSDATIFMEKRRDYYKLDLVLRFTAFMDEKTEERMLRREGR